MSKPCRARLIFWTFGPAILRRRLGQWIDLNRKLLASRQTYAVLMRSGKNSFATKHQILDSKGSLPCQLPGHRPPLHNAHNLSSELAVDDRPPWDKGELMALLDHGELAAG